MQNCVLLREFRSKEKRRKNRKSRKILKTRINAENVRQYYQKIIPRHNIQTMKRIREELIKILKVDFLVGKSALKNWTMILFGVVLCIVMIFSSHLIEQKVHIIAKLNNEVKELQSEFVDVRSRLQRVRLESTVLQSLKESGLKQSETPPQKIKVIVRE